MLKIETTKLQALVGQAVKGAGNQVAIPITTMVGITFEKGTLTLMTTDGGNFMTTSVGNLKGKNFSAVVNVNQFANLVKKTSSKTITLKPEESCLKVKGNGDYTLDIPVDEDDNPVEMIPFEFGDAESATTVKLDQFQRVMGVSRPAVAETIERPALVGYYADTGRVIATNVFKMSVTEADGWFTDPVLIPSELIDLVMVMGGGDLAIERNGDRLRFSTSSCEAIGVQLEELEEYPVDAVTKLLDLEFTSTCRIDKEEFLATLNRLNLFVSVYDHNAVEAVFSPDNLMLRSVRETGMEQLKYQDKKGAEHEPFTCKLDVDMTRSLIQGQDGETLHISYGNDDVLKMVNGRTTQFLALIGNEEE